MLSLKNCLLTPLFFSFFFFWGEREKERRKYSHTHLHIYMSLSPSLSLSLFIYIYIERERERERERESEMPAMSHCSVLIVVWSWQVCKEDKHEKGLSRWHMQPNKRSLSHQTFTWKIAAASILCLCHFLLLPFFFLRSFLCFCCYLLLWWWNVILVQNSLKGSSSLTFFFLCFCCYLLPWWWNVIWAQKLFEGSQARTCVTWKCIKCVSYLPWTCVKIKKNSVFMVCLMLSTIAHKVSI